MDTLLTVYLSTKDIRLCDSDIKRQRSVSEVNIRRQRKPSVKCLGVSKNECVKRMSTELRGLKRSEK